MTSPIEISLLGKSYQVACKDEEKEALMHAAIDLHQRMQAVQRGGGVVGQERIAVMVALNLCHELQQAQQDYTPDLKRDEILARIALKLEKAQSDL